MFIAWKKICWKLCIPVLHAWNSMDILPYLRFNRQIRSFFVSQSKGATPGKYHELVNLRNSTKIQKHIGLWIFRGPLVHLPMYSRIVFASVFCYCLKVSKCDWFDPSHPARSAEVLQLLKPSQELLHQRKMAMRFVMVYGWPCSILQDGVRIPKFIQTNWSIFTVAFWGDKSVASIGVIQGHFVWITSVSFSRGWGSWKYIQASIFRACFMFFVQHATEELANHQHGKMGVEQQTPKQPSRHWCRACWAM